MYEGYKNRSGAIAAVTIVESIVTTCVVLRFWNRHRQRSKILLSDWLILPAYICGLGLTILEI